MKITVPELGEEITSATVACWHVNVGDRVNEDDDLVELVTAKASFNVPTSASGVLKEIYCVKGQDVNIGQELGLIEI